MSTKPGESFFHLFPGFFTFADLYCSVLLPCINAHSILGSPYYPVPMLSVLRLPPVFSYLSRSRLAFPQIFLNTFIFVVSLVFAVSLNVSSVYYITGRITELQTYTLTFVLTGICCDNWRILSALVFWSHKHIDGLTFSVVTCTPTVSRSFKKKSKI